ncbi:MAG: hypothetical protein HC915_01670 [Anaerolineae bacterium]|nr:hypothetical protein [Anaerolineae bacterium]
MQGIAPTDEDKWKAVFLQAVEFVFVFDAHQHGPIGQLQAVDAVLIDAAPRGGATFARG